MKKSHIKATSLRSAMSAVVFIIIILSSVGFYYAQDWLNQLAIEIGSTVSESTAGSDDQALKQLQDDIARNQISANKANNIIAPSHNYQSLIVEDLNKYASSTGVSIASYKWDQSVPAGTSALAAIDGVSSGFITITLDNPVTFTNLIQFIKAIESNLPKMQITGISLSRDSNSANAVTVEPITIGVYTK